MPRLLALSILGFSTLSLAVTVAQNCSALDASLTTRNVNVLNASYVPISALNASFPNATFALSIPFCRLYGQVNVLNQSTVNFEVWLPDAQSYNGRFLAVGMCDLLLKLCRLVLIFDSAGNGGLAGTIDENAMLLGVSQGFATAG